MYVYSTIYLHYRYCFGGLHDSGTSGGRLLFSLLEFFLFVEARLIFLRHKIVGLKNYCASTGEKPPLPENNSLPSTPLTYHRNQKEKRIYKYMVGTFLYRVLIMWARWRYLSSLLRACLPIDGRLATGDGADR